MLDVVWVPVWIQLVVTFPTGYLRDRFDRFVVGLAYALAAAFALKELLLVGDWWQVACNPECLRNVFVVWPDAVLHDRVTNVIVAGFCLVLIPLVIVALWRHWRAAAGRPPDVAAIGRRGAPCADHHDGRGPQRRV